MVTAFDCGHNCLIKKQYLLATGGPFYDRVYPRIVSFSAYFSRHVGAGFTGGQVSSDGGALLLREVDRKINFLARLANCFTDQRAAGRVEHSLPTMLAQRSFPHVRRACLPAAFPPEQGAIAQPEKGFVVPRPSPNERRKKNDSCASPGLL